MRCNIEAEAAGELLHWSLSGVKRLKSREGRMCSWGFFGFSSHCLCAQKYPMLLYLAAACVPITSSAKATPLRPQKYQLHSNEEHDLFFDLLERLLDYEPKERLTAREALAHPFFRDLHATCSAAVRYSSSRSRWLTAQAELAQSPAAAAPRADPVPRRRRHLGSSLLCYSLLFAFLVLSVLSNF